MAIKKCPKCQYVSEDEALSICPLCDAELEEIDDTQEDNDISSSDVTADTESGLPVDSVESNEECETEDSNEDSTEDSAEEPVKSKKGYITAIALLAVLIVAGALYIGMSFFGRTSTPKTIDIESFSKENVSGLFTNELQGRYFEFTIKDTEVQIPSEDAELPESEASSDAEATSDAAEPVETEMHDGIFVSAFTEEYISMQCAAEYIRMNDLTADFNAYVKENKLADDDYGAYVKAKKLEEDVNAFDEEYGFTQYMQGNASNGTWKLEDMTVKLFDSNGNPMYNLQVTPYGLVNDNTYFKGDMKSGKTINAAFETVAKDVDVGDGTVADLKQSLIFYKDGNFILKGAYDIEPVEENFSAGFYTINDNVITIDLQGSKNKFLVVDDGICLGVFTK